MLAIMGTAVNPRGQRDWAGLVIGITLGFAVMVLRRRCPAPASTRRAGSARRSSERAVGGAARRSTSSARSSALCSPALAYDSDRDRARAQVAQRPIDTLGCPRRRGSRAGPGQRRSSRLPADAPPRHLLAQRHAVAVADLPLLLQVLRVRDAPGASARARRGRCAARRRREAPRQGAAGAHRRAPGGPTRGRASGCASWGTATSSPTWCGRASARSSAGCCRTRTSASLVARGPGAAARGDRLAGADAGVGRPGPRRRTRARRRRTRRGGSRRSARPASCGSPSRAGSSWASASRRRSAWPRSRRWPRCTPSTAPAGGDPAELRAPPELLRREPATSPTEAARDFWRTGRRERPERHAGLGDRGVDRGHAGADRRGARA